MSQYSRTSKSSLDEHVGSKEEEQYEEMLYYQGGDIVFAKHNDFLWPAKIVKPLNNYQQYKIFLFEIKIHVIFAMKYLVDYNLLNRQKSIQMLNLHQKDKNTRQKFFIALRAANYYYKQLKRKEEARSKQKEIEGDSLMHKHYQIEQEMSKEQSYSHIDTTQHKEDHPQQVQKRIKKKQYRPFKFSRQVKNIVDQNSFKNQASMRKKTRMQERFSLHHQFSINHQQIISNSLSSPCLKGEQSMRERPQCRRMRQRMVHKSMNREFNYFSSQKDIARKEQLILQQKEMIAYVSLYQAIFQELDLHLAALQSLPEAVCIKICTNALDKLFKALTETKKAKFTISNFLPLLKTILGSQLIKIERMVSEDILVRLLILVRTSKQPGCNSQLFKQQVQYLHEVCRQLKIKYILGDECSMSVKQKLQEIFRRTTFVD